jgi:imidazolonepropionase-like amidohydrolase
MLEEPAMRPATALLVALAAAGVAAGAAPARAGSPIALRGAELRTVSGAAIPNGMLLVADGKILALGPADRVAVPPDAEVRDLAGRVIVPGLVDTHSHIGIYPRPNVPAHADGNELSGPVQSRLRALDAIWPEDPGIRMALAGGITTANIMPGSGNVVGGQTAYVKLRGRTVEDMLIHPGGVQGGLKMANGENPKRTYTEKGQAPFTRMAVAALARDLFVRAAERRDGSRRKAGKEDADRPERSLELEPIVEVLEGRRTVHHHTHRADDIRSVLRLQEEFGFDLVLQHATEAYKLADLLAAREIPVSLIVTDSPGGKYEFLDYRLDAAGALERAGVLVAIHTDDPITHSRLFLRSGALAVRGGMSEDGALAALTLAGARMLWLDDRLGSLEPGKDADFAVLSGPPFAASTQVLETWIEGVRVFDRADPEQRRWATGGIELPPPAPPAPPAPGEAPR